MIGKITRTERKMKKLIEQGVYRVVDNPFEEQAGIELLEGEYKGLVYQYNKVQLVDGEPQLNFDRVIRRLPEGVEKSEESIQELLNNSELKSLMGDILVELLEEQVKNEQRNSKRTDKET